RFKRQVVDGKRAGKDTIFLTSTDIVRVSPNDRVLWSLPFSDHQWTSGGKLVDLPGGDILAFRYGEICDSGVDLVRFTPLTGKTVWGTNCDRLGTRHSEYYHEASVLLERDSIRVTSKGSHGTVVEILELKSGRSLKRTVKRAE